MIRQLGGSFGVALVGTYLERTMFQNRVSLLPNISLYDPETQQRLQGLVASFMAKGASLMQAQQQAYAALEGSLMKQTAIITYAQTFLLIGAFFLLCLPLMFIIKRNRPGQAVDLNAAH